jgi:hypothetical protein
MRDNWLSNHIFQSGEDIVDYCCNAWNKLIEQPDRINPSETGNGQMGHDQRRLV